MNTDQAQQLVVGSIAVTGVVTSVSMLADGRMPGLPVVVGLGVTGVVLAVGAQFRPDLAGGLAVLIMVTDVFVFAGPLWRAINGLTGQQRQAQPSHPARRPHRQQ